MNLNRLRPDPVVSPRHVQGLNSVAYLEENVPRYGSGVTGIVRWTAQFDVSWKPILTFGRRKDELLEWFEQSIEPFAFMDRDQRVGVAIDSEAQKVEVDVVELSIRLSGARARPEILSPAIAGAMEIMEPQRLLPREYRGLWTSPLESEYERTAADLAKRSTRSDSVGGFGRPADCAYLVDLESESGLWKIEFGVVTGEELKDRLSDPEGRVGGEHRPVIDPEEVDAEASSVHLFVEVLWRSKDTEVTTPSSEAILASLDTVEKEITSGIQQLAENL